MRPFLILLLLCLTMTPLAAAENPPPPDRIRMPGPAERQAELRRRAEEHRAGAARSLRDVAYVPGGHERQKLDLFLPATGTNFPVIVWIHGGAWLGGGKENSPALPFVREGYAVASVNYRLSQHATYPAQIEDSKAAIRWLRANAGTHGLDPERIAAWGASAGGHLAALLGTTGDVTNFDKGPNLEFSSRVRAVCDFFGPTDLREIGKFPSDLDHNAPDSPESRLLGGPVLEVDRAVADAANPITFITPSDPPFLILHGDNDRVVPLNQSELLEAALKKAGVPVTLHVVKGVGHGFAGPEIEKMVREFFAKHLRERK